MGRATTKADLLAASAERFERLLALMRSMTDVERQTPFDFSNDEKKKEAHWGRDKNVRDILVHLYEWHQLLLCWVAANMNGELRPFLPAPYNWRTYGEMNVGFWLKHQNTPLAEAETMFAESHQAVLTLAETFSDEALFTKKFYPWVGGSTLGSYFVSATASHYDWAIKKLKAHQKNCETRL